MAEKKSRNLYLLRHAERVDYTFPNWIPQCFDKNGNYTPTNLNMPEILPKRAPSAFSNDSPITRIGMFQAEITGQAFKKNHLEITDVYCSPALRCVQTCDAFLKGCNKRDQIKIKIEPGLYECLQLFSGLPDLMTPEELVAAGYNIDLNYKPYINLKTVDPKEDLQQYFLRGYSTTMNVLNSDGNKATLLVAHAGNFENCLRELLGKKGRGFDVLCDIIPKIPYCYLMRLREVGEKWKVLETPFLGLLHTDNKDFDRELLLK